MKLYKILLITIAILSSITSNAQETCPLPIMVMVDNSDGYLSEQNEKLLDAKLQQLVSSRGFGSSAELSHLCLRATVSDTGEKEVISGTRPMVVGSFDVYLVLTNLLSGENFGADNISVRGNGNNETQMLQRAMSRINPSNTELQRFLQNARVKVFDYYRSHIPSIISQALALSQRGNYDKALYLLSTVPPCVEGYDTVSAFMLKVFDEYLDVDCHEKLAAARSVWKATQNEEGAQAAAAYLAAIDHRSSCYSEAQELLAEISGKIDENIRRFIAREDEDRALEKELIRGEAELERKKVDNDFALRQQEIDAIRQIAQAYVQSVIGPMIQQNGQSQSNNQSQPVQDGGEGRQKGSPVIIVNN